MFRIEMFGWMEKFRKLLYLHHNLYLDEIFPTNSKVLYNDTNSIFAAFLSRTWFFILYIFMFYCNSLGLLIQFSHQLNAIGYLSTLADHVHPFITRIYNLLMAISSVIRHHGTNFSNWFHEHDNEFGVLQWPSHSPDMRPVERL